MTTPYAQQDEIKEAVLFRPTCSNFIHVVVFTTGSTRETWGVHCEDSSHSNNTFEVLAQILQIYFFFRNLYFRQWKEGMVGQPLSGSRLTDSVHNNAGLQHCRGSEGFHIWHPGTRLQCVLWNVVTQILSYIRGKCFMIVAHKIRKVLKTD